MVDDEHDEMVEHDAQVGLPGWKRIEPNPNVESVSLTVILHHSVRYMEARMRSRDVNRKMFHAGHYNVIANRFREQLTPLLEAHASEDSEIIMAARGALIELALALAKRFALDNDEFDPVIFLDRCSPDPYLYPLSELWDGVSQVEHTDD